MSKDYASGYEGRVVSASPTPDEFLGIVADYRAMLLTVMQVIVERFERIADYPWIDTKLSLITGEDYRDDDLVRGRDTVYGWIQGRGLEALAGHAVWMASGGLPEEPTELIERIRGIMRCVLAELRAVRRKNGGHLFFFLNRQGEPFMLEESGEMRPTTLSEQSPYNFSDMFGAKGMYVAADYLQDESVKDEARQYCVAVYEAIIEGSFVTDQQPLDPKNPIRPVPGRHSQGPTMIEIGAAALLTQYEKSSEWVERGLTLIEWILANHVNLKGRWDYLREYDFVEFIDDDGAPYRQDGQIVSDSGHSLEFVGLAWRFTDVVKSLGLADTGHQNRLADIERVLPDILFRNFENGIQRKVGGFCKTVDLLSREPINSDLPWWIAPETIRAAAGCWRMAKGAQEKQRCLGIIAECHNMFVRHYVRRELNLMAVQTRDISGKVVDVIPATSDADPGYHTSLSLIDALKVLEELSQEA